MPGTVAAAMGCQNAGVRVAMGVQMPTAYLTGLLTGAVADAVTDRRIQWRVLGTTTLLILGAAAVSLPGRVRRQAVSDEPPHVGRRAGRVGRSRYRRTAAALNAWLSPRSAARRACAEGVDHQVTTAEIRAAAVLAWEFTDQAGGRRTGCPPPAPDAVPNGAVVDGFFPGAGGCAERAAGTGRCPTTRRVHGLSAGPRAALHPEPLVSVHE